MSRVHVLDGRGLDAAVREVMSQVVLWYPSQTDRDADIKVPWEGATTLYPDSTGTLRLEGWHSGSWRPLGGSGGGGRGCHRPRRAHGLGRRRPSAVHDGRRGDHDRQRRRCTPRRGRDPHAVYLTATEATPRS